MATAHVRKDLERIQERNKRVEADKAWETSKTRRAVIAIVTYVIAALYMEAVALPMPWLSALIPSGAYVLSTFSLSFIKKWWVQNAYKK